MFRIMVLQKCILNIENRDIHFTTIATTALKLSGKDRIPDKKVKSFTYHLSTDASPCICNCFDIFTTLKKNQYVLIFKCLYFCHCKKKSQLKTKRVLIHLRIWSIPIKIKNLDPLLVFLKLRQCMFFQPVCTTICNYRIKRVLFLLMVSS